MGMEGALRRVGFSGFLMGERGVEEFECAAALDERWGTRSELDKLRQAIAEAGDGMDNNPYISAFGRLMLRKIQRDELQNRRRVIEYYEANRSYIESSGRFEKPVLITGCFRGGTTLLHRLMSEDPASRSPYAYEIDVPVPPRRATDDPGVDPRVEASEGLLCTLNKIAPGLLEKFTESHHIAPMEREESFVFSLSQNGLPMMPICNAGYRFIDTFLDPEAVAAVFKYEKLFYTMLDAWCPAQSHWVLKAPNYSPYMTKLFDTYSDARVIICHRTPLESLPSTCRMLETICLPQSVDGSFNKHRFGTMVKSLLKNFFDVPMQYRREHPSQEPHFLDCMYDDLVMDPVAMVKRIYQHFNMDYSDEFEQRMRAYLKDNGQGSQGRHHYSMEEYGFTPDVIYRSYHEYMHCYGFSANP